ncbi:hypothetical protein [Modestobacter sp. SYSU DS0290]
MHSRRTFLPPVTRRLATGSSSEADDGSLPADALEWSWPPYAPVEGRSFADQEWAPPSVVWHPQVRLGRWTVVYRRSA